MNTQEAAKLIVEGYALGRISADVLKARAPELIGLAIAARQRYLQTKLAELDRNISIETMRTVAIDVMDSAHNGVIKAHNDMRKASPALRKQASWKLEEEEWKVRLADSEATLKAMLLQYAE